MGEPAIPTDEERAFVRAYAESVVTAVRNDEEQPLPTYPDGDAMGEDTMIFHLAREVQMLEEDLVTANAELLAIRSEDRRRDED